MPANDPGMSPTPPALPDPLPLFPLHTVLFPGALLGLKVFETRYLDLVSECLRSGQPFGVVCLRQGAEAGPSPAPVQLESVGVLAHIDDFNSRLQVHFDDLFNNGREVVFQARIFDGSPIDRSGDRGLAREGRGRSRPGWGIAPCRSPGTHRPGCRCPAW